MTRLPYLPPAVPSTVEIDRLSAFGHLLCAAEDLDALDRAADARKVRALARELGLEPAGRTSDLHEVG